MGDLLSEFGDLVFTLVIGYIGAVEFLYVVRHLYHWSCNHDGPDHEEHDADSLARLQESMRQQLANATATEQAAGKKAMRDGVLYEDGFRTDPNQADIDKLKDQLAKKSAKDVKRQELEQELDNQKQIAENIRKELKEAEAEVAERQKKEAEENAKRIREAELQREREQRKREEEEAEKKRLVEEKQRKQRDEEEEKRKKKAEEERRHQQEAEENARRLKEAEEQREREQRQREEEEENARLIVEAERLREQQQREAEEHAEREENERRILEAERQREEEQRMAEEMEEGERKILDIERNLEEQMHDSEASDELTDNERQLIASIKERGGVAEQQDEASDQREAELLKRILAAREQLGEESEEEQSQRLFDFERDKEKKQKRIDENARLFLEAEKEMAVLQEQMMEAVHQRDFESGVGSVPQTPVVEEPCIKKSVCLLEDDTSPNAPVSHRVKTQLAQNRDDPYSISSKSLLFPGISDDASSNEPISSQQSSFSTQHSEDITTGNESQYPQQERQEPEGEDTSGTQQYSDDYLRSLDGIKGRPLSREDRSGRRVAFKKRRSSGSSNSSRDSRTSRDEELKMFTSLEEEEMQAASPSQFAPIRYSSEPTLKVKSHHRRHKRSPAKDMKSGEDSLRSSLERLNEEAVNPWGDVVPEHYKHTEFWKREKAVSIEEEHESEKPLSGEETAYDTATNLPSASSFEEATQIQNEEALTNLRKKDSNRTETADDKGTEEEETARSDNNANLQTPSIAEKGASPSASSALPRLRRSPRTDEMDQYEERWKESAAAQSSAGNTPLIKVDKPLDFGPWRDEYGLVMEGLSDFYDFTASVNPSRSRSASRNPSPASTAPNTPQPKDVSFQMQGDGRVTSESVVEVYDDTNMLEDKEFSKENINNFIDSLQESNKDASDEGCKEALDQSVPNHHLQYVSDDHTAQNIAHFPIPLLNVIDETTTAVAASQNDSNDDMNSLVASLRAQRNRRSRSRSKSPLPTPQNLQKSLETRRYKMIKHNEDVLEKLIETNLLPTSPETTTASTDDDDGDSMSLMVDSDRDVRSRSRSRLSSSSSAEEEARQSRSRSKSPLPTSANIQRSLESRRNKRIKHNEDILDKLIESKLLPASTDSSPTPSACDDATDDCSKEAMTLLVESLRAERSKSRSRSRCCSPLPSVELSVDFSRNDELCEKFSQQMQTTESSLVFTAPLVAIEVTEADTTNALRGEEGESSRAPSVSSPAPSPFYESTDDCSKEAMTLLVESLRTERSRSRSRSRCRSPLRSVDISVDFSRNDETFSETTEIPLVFTAPLVSIEVTEPDTTNVLRAEEEECSSTHMDSLVQSLRVARSRTRSKSPMRLPTAENLSKSLESRRSKLIEFNDEIQQQLEQRAKTPEPSQLTVEYVYEFVEAAEESAESSLQHSRHSRSRTPSRSPSLGRDQPEATDGTPFSRNPSRPESPSQDSSFHLMLNLEGSQNKTLSIKSEEQESTLADRQKQLDEEALDKLRNASEEVELRTLSPVNAKDQEGKDLLTDLPSVETRKKLRCSPTTPDYDRTISEEMKDVDRIKQEMLEKGFKRSTYVGESMDLVGREYEPLRREAARFQRSQSPSPSFSEAPAEPGQLTAAERRRIQDLVLAELTDSSEKRSTGAVPKTPGGISTDSEASIDTEMQDTLRIKEEMLRSGFQRSTYVGHSIDAMAEYEEMRRRNAEFRRSASKSRSPLGDIELAELKAIEAESARRELKDMVLDEISNNCMSFQNFSRSLNANFLETDRRASDSALIRKPEMLMQLQDDYGEGDIEPEEYHHFRRFSLAQEQPVEEYPGDDYIFIEQVEVRTRSGSRLWATEDFYAGENVDDMEASEEDEKDFVAEEAEAEAEEDEEREEELSTAERGYEEDNMSHSKETSPDATAEDLGEIEDNSSQVDDNELYEFDDNDDDDDEDSNGSEDDRRTVIEVDDEIDEDISDFNDRGPAEESHHEQSECEEAEREMDRYAGREASDWVEVDRVERVFSLEQEDEPLSEDPEGAVGGAGSSPYDSDSFAIDQIYDEAIRNRKQSGILREFDNILSELSKSSRENSIKDIDEQYALWSKTHKKSKNIEFNSSLIDSERRDTEMRYLGDANVLARQSIRLHSRYGYNPILQSSTKPDDIEVDLNYKPKREYNWRKNFRLSDDDVTANKKTETQENGDGQVEWDLDDRLDDVPSESFDTRKYSLGGESVTLFSRSPEKTQSNLVQEPEPETINEKLEEVKEVEAMPLAEVSEEKQEKPKKKKTKKKSRKGSKSSVEALARDDDNDNDDYEPPIYSRRSSSIQMEMDSPKRKSRSRRSSRSSLTNEDSSLGMFSPRSSIGYVDPIGDIMEEYADAKETARPKKVKKRKKVKEVMEVMADVTENPREEMYNGAESELLPDIETTVSAAITPESASVNLLSTLSPQESICVTPGSEESESSLNLNPTTNANSSSQPTSSTRPSISLSFDILKDANFYPLF
ncbi:protein split ends isoform X1 [Stomoxys calcitrans]|uniref:protein split ends isoform X1 n=1 Tax=Stomoxys calcitrans TaxID=35570 RepID=UPI0027E35820|nr:protein split ends isoform X1 [Stomoxys calcitrans]